MRDIHSFVRLAHTCSWKTNGHALVTTAILDALRFEIIIGGSEAAIVDMARIQVSRHLEYVLIQRNLRLYQHASLKRDVLR